jgi:preprotein translocase subunit SecF
MASLANFGNDLYTGKRSFEVVGRRKLWFAIGAVLIVASFVVLFVKGINPGIDFRGGSQFTVSGAQTLEQSLADEAVVDAGGEPPRVAVVGSDSLRVQTSELSNDQTAQVRDSLADAYGVSVDDVTSTFVGPTWGADVTNQAIVSLVIFLALVSVVMILYFRAWTYAAGAIIALLHDLILTVGVYAAIGFEVTPSTVIGFLTILGYSLYDTVVVFDKVRENTAHVLEQGRYTYAERSNLAVNQTLVRSINTSVTGLLPATSRSRCSSACSCPPCRPSSSRHPPRSACGCSRPTTVCTRRTSSTSVPATSGPGRRRRTRPRTTRTRPRRTTTPSTRTGRTRPTTTPCPP